MRIHSHYAEATAKSKPSKIVGFKEYMVIASCFGPIDKEVSSIKDEKQDEELEGEVASTVWFYF